MDPERHRVRVPATTANLGPGFDAFGAAVTCYLTATITPRAERRVTTTGDGAEELAGGDDNLVWRSLVAFCETYDQPVPDISLAVANDVPLERGLGSSSAAIVAGLALGRVFTDAAVGDRELVTLASQLEGHPDNVVPALLGGLTASAPGADGKLSVRRAQPAPRLRPVVFVPTVRQLTSEARGVLPSVLDRQDAVTQAARAGHVLGALLGAWPVDVDLAGDVLHEPVRLRGMAASGALVADLREAGVHAWLSGAGPSVAAAVGRRDEPAARRCGEVAAHHGFDVRFLDWDLAGATVLRGGDPTAG